MSEKRFNLFALAVREKSVTIFRETPIVVMGLAGRY